MRHIINNLIFGRVWTWGYTTKMIHNCDFNADNDDQPVVLGGTPCSDNSAYWGWSPFSCGMGGQGFPVSWQDDRSQFPPKKIWSPKMNRSNTKRGVLTPALKSWVARKCHGNSGFYWENWNLLVFEHFWRIHIQDLGIFLYYGGYKSNTWMTQSWFSVGLELQSTSEWGHSCLIVRRHATQSPGRLVQHLAVENPPGSMIFPPPPGFFFGISHCHDYWRVLCRLKNQTGPMILASPVDLRCYGKCHTAERSKCPISVSQVLVNTNAHLDLDSIF